MTQTLRSDTFTFGGAIFQLSQALTTGRVSSLHFLSSLFFSFSLFLTKLSTFLRYHKLKKVGKRFCLHVSNTDFLFSFLLSEVLIFNIWKVSDMNTMYFIFPFHISHFSNSSYLSPTTSQSYDFCDHCYSYTQTHTCTCINTNTEWVHLVLPICVLDWPFVIGQPIYDRIFPWRLILVT